VPLALFGAAWAGRPFVPLNYRLTGPEVDALIERVAPVLIVTDRERAQSLAGRPGVVTVLREDLLAEARASAEPPAADWGMEPEDVAIWLFTSGTTGAPKAALLRHRHLVSYILGSVEYMGAGEDDAALVSVPPYHVAGMAALLSSIYSGRRIVQLPAFSPERWLELAESERISNAFVVPTMLARVVERLEATRGKPPATLRSVAYGGGKMPLPVIERAMRLFEHTSFTNAYGLTETSSTLCVLGPDDHRDAACSDDPNVRRRLSSVGKPLPGVELEIRDAEGKPVGAGERGEICVRGEQVSGEYLGRASRVGADGWFPTNDGGFVDEGGYLFVEGRIDDVIVRGGENLSPGEVEDVLLEHPAVSDVAVVGVPDVEWGEGVAAAVVLKEGAAASAEELQDWVRKHLRSSRVPQLVRFERELPYNETGKLLRRKVRERLGPA
jgi:acyl-CoA synthetase (AMP-forming)/AMP-acid ligase II